VAVALPLGSQSSAVTGSYGSRGQSVWERPSPRAKDLPPELVSIFGRRRAMADLLGFDLSDYLMFDFKAYLSCSSAVTPVGIPLVSPSFSAQEVGLNPDGLHPVFSGAGVCIEGS
jgi:hypothetical protein